MQIQQNSFFVRTWDKKKVGFIPISKCVPEDMTVEEYIKEYEKMSGTEAEKLLLTDGSILWCLVVNDALQLPVFRSEVREVFVFDGDIATADQGGIIMN